MTVDGLATGTPVVIPFDGSDDAARAFGPATELAALVDGPLRVVSAVEDAHEIDRRRAELEVHPAVVALGPDARVVVVADPFAVGAITAEPGAVVCMATSANPVHVDRYLGSMAEKVVRESGGPTLLVGPRCGPTPVLDVAKVVVPLDGTAAAATAVAAAARLATLLDGSVETVHVASRHGAPVDADVTLEPGDVAARLIEHAGDSAVIAMATRGRSGLSRLFGGSTMAAVLRLSGRPVLVVDGRHDTRETGP